MCSLAPSKICVISNDTLFYHCSSRGTLICYCEPGTLIVEQSNCFCCFGDIKVSFNLGTQSVSQFLQTPNRLRIHCIRNRKCTGKLSKRSTYLLETHCLTRLLVDLQVVSINNSHNQHYLFPPAVTRKFFGQFANISWYDHSQQDKWMILLI